MADGSFTTRIRRRFRRSTADRMLGGVCGGISDLTGVDSPLVRVGFLVLTLASFGTAAVLYLGCCLLVPEEGTD
ncbi:PspC domain-containing protein [Actinoalloteichus spitiensis]|uniref:PspC domain-containing protein n=1 Tax=Actinoalloteichus spitiensis TaxID=252394 RepID=UPI0002F56D77|nr:PspC domain-containing protein [Actinoalloteichus spitiensis]